MVYFDPPPPSTNKVDTIYLVVDGASNELKMGDKRGERDKRRSAYDTPEAGVSTARDRLRKLCECERVVSYEEILAHGRINRDVADSDGNASSSDEVDELLEAEHHRLNDVLGLPVDTYSLTRISPNLPACVKYGVRSGLTNQRMQKFSPLSRGFQVHT